MTLLDREILPDNVVPRHYDIVLELDLEKCEYKGIVTIDLDTSVESKSITLNTRDLNYQSTNLQVDGNTIGAADFQTFDEKLDRVTLSWKDQVIKAGSKAKLSIEFDGTLNDQMGGLYRAKYKNRTGKDCWMAATQMQPVDCRRAFPCFDEPALKAESTMTIIASPELTCLSNMDMNKEYTTKSKFDGSTKKAVLFNTTPKMSTYLVALTVGEFDCIETNAFRVPIRALVPPSEKVENARHALELTARTLEFYEAQFDCPFPLPKVDMAGVPGRPGAMENWGLLLYAPDRLLYDPLVDSAMAWSRRSETIQHELAHQWFGNIVTMDFWDGLWLNEGFATWMAKYSGNFFNPDWKIWQKYVGEDHIFVLDADSVRSSHPVEMPVRSAGQINEIFDAISYMKGQAIIRMIVGYLGEDVFMKGIQKYLAKHAYGNTQTVDLWNALEEVSSQPVSQIMSVWTKTTGYPVVTVTELPGNKILLEQHRFLQTGDVTAQDDTTLYPIAIGLRTKLGVDKSVLMTGRTQEVSVPDLDFFKLNADHVGFYRTAYSPERLARLGENARAGLLSVEDRAGLLSDAVALSIAGNARTSGLLAFVRNLGDEDDLVVWKAIWHAFESLNSAWKFEDENTRLALRKLTGNIVAPLVHKMGWVFSDQDSHINRELKAFLFDVAEKSDDSLVLNACHDMFQRYKAGDESAIAPDMRNTVFTSAMKKGSEEDFQFLVQKYKNSPTIAEKGDAILALGCAQNPELVDRLLEFMLSDDVEPMHMFKVVMSSRSSPLTTYKIWAWFQNRFEKIMNKLPAGLGVLGYFVKFSIDGFTSLEKAAEIEEFFKEKDTSAYKLNLEQGLDQIRANAGWVNRDREDVRQYLIQTKLLADD